MSDFRTIVKIKAHFSKIFTQLLGKIKKVVKFFFFSCLIIFLSGSLTNTIKILVNISLYKFTKGTH